MEEMHPARIQRDDPQHGGDSAILGVDQQRLIFGPRGHDVGHLIQLLHHQIAGGVVQVKFQAEHFGGYGGEVIAVGAGGAKVKADVAAGAALVTV